MLMLQKVLAIILLPSGLVFLSLFFGLLFRKRLLLLAGTLMFLVFSMPVLSDAFIRSLEGEAGRVPVETVPAAGAIVVPGGMTRQVAGALLGEWGEASDRFEGGIDLYRAGKAPFLVFTRGRLPWRVNEVPEGELLARRAVRLGIPEKAILLTDVAGNTAEEAAALRRLFNGSRGQAVKRIILVTSAYHMPRASMLFERAGFSVIPYRVDFQVAAGKSLTILSFLPDAEAFLKSEKAVREMLGIGVWAMSNEQ